MATKDIAKWATSLTFESVPKTVVHAARRSLYNWMGCAIYGSSHPTVLKAHRALEPLYGAAKCQVLGSEIRTDAQHAALLNGIASHVHDYDDTHLATIIHPTGPVASAALAWAQWTGGTTGQDLILAVIAGIEVECKLGLAVWPEHYDIGWHITSTVGSIGAAVAVAKLMGHDQEKMEQAIGLAAVQVIGLREMFGSDTKSFHPGRAAQAGLLAALLSREGYTSSSKAIEAKRGWANVVAGGGKPQIDRFVAELGTVWETVNNAFKPFPCGIVKHPVIDGAIRLHERLQQSESLTECLNSLRFDVLVHPLVIELTSKPAPRDGLEAKFSVSHGAAVGLLYGKAGPAQYEDDVVKRTEVVRVRDSVKAIETENLRSDEAVIKAINSSGEVIQEIHVDHAIGSLEKPMSDDQIRDKFIDQVALSFGNAEAKKLSEVAWNLIEMAEISQHIPSQP